MLFHAYRLVPQCENIDMANTVERDEIAEPNWQALDAMLNQTIDWLNEDGVHSFPGSAFAISTVMELCRIVLMGDLKGEMLMNAFSEHCREAAIWLLEFNHPEWSDRDSVIGIVGSYRH